MRKHIAFGLELWGIEVYVEDGFYWTQDTTGRGRETAEQYGSYYGIQNASKLLENRIKEGVFFDYIPEASKKLILDNNCNEPEAVAVRRYIKNEKVRLGLE